MTSCQSEQHEPTTPSSINKEPGAETCRFAKKLDESKWIYALYGMLDGLSLSYSTIKYFFDVLPLEADSSSSDQMHQWLVSPVGAVIAATESITLIVLSMLGNHCTEKSKTAFKRYIAMVWPYCRDSLKGLKNGYKGVRSLLLALTSITGENLNYMIVPVGVALGALSMANRYCMRRFVVEPRKAMTKKNAELLLKIQGTAFHLLKTTPNDMTPYLHSFILVDNPIPAESPILYYVNGDSTCVLVTITDPAQLIKNIESINSAKASEFYLSDKQLLDLITDNGGYIPPIVGLDQAGCDKFRAAKETQSPDLNAIALFGAAYGGLVDGLYLYMGSLGLAVLASPAFMFMASCSLIFAVLCIVTRVYEEYDFQRKFHATQAKIELAICGKELEALLATLQRLSNPLKPTRHSDNELVLLADNLDMPSVTHNIVKELRDSRTLFQQALSNSTHSCPGFFKQEDDAPRTDYVEKLKRAYTEKLSIKQTEFEQKREQLRGLVTLSSSLAFFAGIRNGLACFSAITSLMFTAGIICTIGAVTLSPVVLLTCMTLGIAGLILHVVYSLINHAIHQRDEKMSVAAGSNNKLSVFLEEIKRQDKEARDLKPTEVKEAITGGMVVDPSPQFFIQESWEVVRSLGSGVYKGQKLVEFVQSMFHGIGLPSGEENTTVLLDITICTAVIQALIFSLRALARGFGRDALDVVPSKTIPKPVSVIPIVHQTRSISPRESSWLDFFLPASDSSPPSPRSPTVFGL